MSFSPKALNTKKIQNGYKHFVLASFFLATLALSGFFVRSFVSAATGINEQISFQGKVVNNTSGTNITNGSYTFLFCLYTTASPATPCTGIADNDAVWRESKSLTVTDGIFQTNLGDTTTLPGSVDFNTDNIYLGINFNGDGQMTPLVRFTAAPYAMNAAKVGGLTVTDTTGTLTIPNGKTVQFADAFTTTGAFPLTLTATASTTATLPAGTITLVDLATSQSLTNKTIGSTGLTFSGAATDITTATDESLVIMANGTGIVDIQDALTADSLTVDTGGVSIAAGQSYTGAGAVTLSSATTNALTVDSGTTGAVNLGTGNNAKTISLGTGTAGNTINIGTNNTTADTINIGSVLDNIAITSDSWSITDAGALTVVSCSGCGGGGGTLDSAYAAGNTITTDSGSDVIITLQDVVTPTSFVIENQDTAGVSGQRIYNSIASGTLTNGLLIEQTGAGTLTNGIQIAETAGTITDGILITGTLGNILNSATLDITGAGAITGATGITSSGTITFSGLSTAGIVTNTAGGVLGTTISVPVANGGTNATTIGGAGSIAYSTGSAYAFSGVGTTGQALVSGGTGAPTFFAPTAGSIIFAGTGGILEQDNANFFYDNSTNRLGLGTTAPSATLDILGTTNALRLSYDVSNYASLSALSDGTLNVTSSNVTESQVIIGTGASVDDSIGFDGASQDYYAGLDHTTGFFTIGTGFTVGSSTLFAIDSTGNVGIGTGVTAPAARLDLALTSTSATGATEYGQRTILSDTGIVTTGTDTTYGSSTSVTRTGATGGTINSYGNYTLLSTDNAGAGTSTAYGSYIDTGVATATNADTIYGQYITTESNAGTAYGLYVDAGAGAGTEYAGIFTGGNFGIGDATPDNPLEITSTSQQLRLSYTDGSVDGVIAVDSNEYLTLQAGTTSEINRVQIGAGGAGNTTPDFFSLDVKSDTGDPAGGFEGAMYYNTFDNKFRCYQNAAWTDCIGTGGTVPADSLDFIDFEDILDLDAALTLNQTTNTWSQTFTGDTTTGLTYTANSLTSGKALSIESSAAAFTGSLANITLSGSNAANTGNLLLIADTGVLNTTTPFKVTGAGAATQVVALIENTGAGTSFRVNDVGSDTTPFVIDAAGNVGIGTTAPTTMFELYGTGSADAIATLTAPDATYDPIMKFRTAASPAVQFTLGVDNSDSDKFKIYSGDGLGSGDEFVIDSNGVTTIANLNLGATSFDEDAGAVTWVDMSVTSGATVGTVESYTAQLDGNAMLTIYGTSDGAGSVADLGVGIMDMTPDGALDFDQSSASTTAATTYGGNFTVSDTGIVTTGTDTTYGNSTSVTRTGATGGTINTYGQYTLLSTDNAGAGTSTAYGSYIDTGVAGATNADTIYGQYITTESNAGTAYGLYVDAGAGAGTEYAGIFMNGNVGIGDATPASLFTVGDGDDFQINTTGAITAATGITSSGTITFSGLSTAGIVTNTAGGVLGTTISVPVANGGTNATTIGGAGSIAYSTGSAYAFSGVGTTGQALVSGGTGAPTFFAPTAGSIIFAGTGGILEQDNANFFYDNSTNRLGLGTTAPSATLDILGTTNALRLSYDVSNYASLSTSSNGDLSLTSSNVSEAALIVGSGAAQDTSVQFDGASYDYYAGLDHTSGFFTIGSGFTVGASTLLAIDSTGNVGIGTGVTAPGARLDIASSSTNATAGTEYGQRTILSDTGIVTTGTDTTYGSSTSVTRTGATGGTINTYGQYTLLSTDNAGAGTSTAYGSYIDTGVAGATNADTVYGQYITTESNAGTAYGLYVDAGAGAGTEYSGIFMNGNVGIGDTTPAALLTVGSGDLFQVNSSGAIAAATGITSSGTIAADGGITLAVSQTFSASALSYIDLGSIVHNTTAVQGLRLPQAASATPSNPTSGEGYLAWDAGGNQVIYYNGSAWATFGAGGGYATIKDESTSLTQRTTLAFLGAGVSCVDNVTQTECTISGGAGSDLQGTYDTDADGSNATISLTAADDGLVFTNPASGGNNLSAFLLQLNQAHTTDVIKALDIVQASSGANAVDITANAIDGETGLAVTTNGLTSGSALSVNSSATAFTGNLTGITFSGSDAANTGSLLALDNTGVANTNTSLYVKHYATGTNNLAVRVDDVSGDTTPFVIDGTGSVGIGTTAPARLLDIVQAASTPQLRLSKDLTNYSEMTVDSAGDLLIGATGTDIRALSENLWVCDNDACPALTLTGDGNIFVENVVKFGNGVYMKNDSATELGVYDNDDQAMLIFDEL